MDKQRVLAATAAALTIAGACTAFGAGASEAQPVYETYTHMAQSQQECDGLGKQGWTNDFAPVGVPRAVGDSYPRVSWETYSCEPRLNNTFAMLGQVRVSNGGTGGGGGGGW